MKTKIIAGAIVIASLTGCATGNNSQVPLASTYELTNQQKMQAAHHWDVLAADVAFRVKEHFKTASLTNKAINVVPNSNSTFEQGFEDLLITQMVEQGLDIRANNNEHLKLTFHTQVIRHNDRGYIRPKPGAHTALALIATGVWAVVNIASNSTAAQDALIGAGILGTGIAMDAVAGDISSVTNKEVIISVSLMDGDKYLMRKTGIYYINEPDDGQCETLSKNISVVAE
ncbi:MAG: hypothetical protein IBX57_03070 [Gammaproteobacteria bacterium]|nr:hypothetical protein [Gammaproteobacteria bacterium]